MSACAVVFGLDSEFVVATVLNCYYLYTCT